MSHNENHNHQRGETNVNNIMNVINWISTKMLVKCAKGLQVDLLDLLDSADHIHIFKEACGHFPDTCFFLSQSVLV